jgi:hypothetical protein
MVIDSMDRFPEELKSRPGLASFVWAHEVGMHDAGRGGGNGAADLLTADEDGMIWLIEAKFGATRELGQPVWRQLDRYRTAVAGMSWQKILHYAEAFLQGREETKPSDPVGRGAKSFEQVLANWHERIGRSIVPPVELNQLMARHIKGATYGVMVLADTYVPGVVEEGRLFVHTGPVAYLQAIPADDGVEFKVRWLRSANDSRSMAELHVDADSRFDAYRREINTKCAVDGFENSLCPPARDLWLNVLRPGLENLGWDGTVVRKNPKSFGVAFNVAGRAIALFAIGWTGSDSKAVARMNKLAGSASMRVDVQFNWVLGAPFFDEEFLNRWAARFYRHGWRGRNRNGMETWGVRRIAMSELCDSTLKPTSSGVMQYRPIDSHKGFCGGPGEREAIQGFLQELDELLRDIRR